MIFLVFNKMVKTKSKIEKQLQKKRNPELVETVIAGKKKENWKEVVGIIVGSRKNWVKINLDKIDEKSQEGGVIVVPGKVLSQGEVNKKLKIAALGFSEKAKEKLLNAGCEVSTILEEIKKNPEAKGVKIIKNENHRR